MRRWWTPDRTELLKEGSSSIQVSKVFDLSTRRRDRLNNLRQNLRETGLGWPLRPLLWLGKGRI